MIPIVRKIIFTGPPHSGKTTLLGGLAERFGDGIHITPEPAGSVISRYQPLNGNFWTDVVTSPCDFSEMCIDEAMGIEQAIPSDTSMVLMDRSIVDAIAYMQRDGCTRRVDEAARFARAAMYDMVLFCEPVGTFGDRPETEAEAAIITSHLQDTYRTFGIESATIPALPLDERIEFAADLLVARIVR
jgi:predicted ATPase